MGNALIASTGPATEEATPETSVIGHVFTSMNLTFYSCKLVFRYPLGTSVVSELRRPDPHPAVADWLWQVPDERVCLFARNVSDFKRLGLPTPDPFASCNGRA